MAKGSHVLPVSPQSRLSAFLGAIPSPPVKAHPHRCCRSRCFPAWAAAAFLPARRSPGQCRRSPEGRPLRAGPANPGRWAAWTSEPGGLFPRCCPCRTDPLAQLAQGPRRGVTGKRATPGSGLRIPELQSVGKSAECAGTGEWDIVFASPGAPPHRPQVLH